MALGLGGCPFVPYVEDSGEELPGRRVDRVGVLLEGPPGFGAAAIGGRDLDGDGVGDLVVGSPDELSGVASWTGAVYVYSGATVLQAGDPAPGRLYAGSGSASFGGALAFAGDLNLDGAPDLVVGEVAARPTVAAYVFSGWDAGEDRATEAASARLSMGGLAETPRLAIGDPGDWDDDGVDDLLVAVPNDSGAPSGRLFYVRGPLVGPRDLRSVAAGELRGQGTNPGTSGLVGVGDTDGDGHVDFLAGAPEVAGSSGEAAGVAWILREPWIGAALAPDVLSAITAGTRKGWHVGHALAPAGDTDGDGYADVWVGAVGEGGHAARAALLRGPLAGGATIDDAVAAVLFDDPAEFTLAGGQDVDGDASPDLVVGWPDGGEDEGQGVTWIYTGPKTGARRLAEAAWRLDGERSGDGFGAAVFLLPDLDGDGLADPAAHARSGGLWLLPTTRLGISTDR